MSSDSSKPRNGRIVAVKIDGKIELHARGDGFGDYDTLCGIDANDPTVGHQGVTEVPRGAKVGCDACWSIFKSVKELRATDFAEETKRRRP